MSTVKINKADIFFSALLSILLVLSHWYSREGFFELSPKRAFLIFGVFTLLLLLFSLGRTVLSTGVALTSTQGDKLKILKRLSHWAIGNPESSDYVLPSLRIGCCIFLLWLPILILLYPGSLASDTLAQLDMFMQLPDTTNVTDHHPFFDTIIFGTWIIGLGKLTGSFQFGLFSFVLAQAFITATSFGYLLAVMRKEFCSSALLCNASFLFFSFIILFPVNCAYVVKDSLFSLVFVFFLVDYLRIVKNPALAKNTFLVRFICICIATCLTKKTGGSSSSLHSSYFASRYVIPQNNSLSAP